jgi:hypothetical protein
MGSPSCKAFNERKSEADTSSPKRSSQCGITGDYPSDGQTRPSNGAQSYLKVDAPA